MAYIQSKRENKISDNCSQSSFVCPLENRKLRKCLKNSLNFASFPRLHLFFFLAFHLFSSLSSPHFRSYTPHLLSLSPASHLLYFLKSCHRTPGTHFDNLSMTNLIIEHLSWSVAASHAFTVKVIFAPFRPIFLQLPKSDDLFGFSAFFRSVSAE